MKKKKHVHRVGRGERKERRMEEDAATTGATGAPLPFFPFTRSARLLVQDGSVPF